MEWSTSRIVSACFSEVGEVLELVSEELSRDVDVLTSDHDNLLSVEELLGDCRSQSTKEMPLRVNDDLTFESCDNCQRTILLTVLSSSLFMQCNHLNKAVASNRKRRPELTHCS